MSSAFIAEKDKDAASMIIQELVRLDAEVVELQRRLKQGETELNKRERRVKRIRQAIEALSEL